MPITLSGTLITVKYVAGDAKGDSWTNPFTPDDIVAAAVGVVQEGSLYKFHNLNFIVDGSTTFFRAAGVILKFTGNETIRYAVNTSNSGNLMIGYKGPTTELISQGSIIDYRDLSVNKHFHATHLYGSTVLSSGTSWARTLYNFTADYIEKCLIIGTRTTPVNFVWNIKDTFFVDNYIALNRPSVNSVIEDVIFHQAFASLALQAISGNKYYNIKTEGAPVVAQIFNHQDLQEFWFVNSDITLSHIQSQTAAFDRLSIVHFLQELSFVVTDVDGNKIQDAVINLFNKNDTKVIDNQVTDVDGLFEEEIENKESRLIVPAGSPSGNTAIITDFNPFKLTITKAGFRSLIVSGIELTEGGENIIRASLPLTDPPVYVSDIKSTEIAISEISSDTSELGAIIGIVDDLKISGEITITEI